MMGRELHVWEHGYTSGRATERGYDVANACVDRKQHKQMHIDLNMIERAERRAKLIQERPMDNF